MGYEKSNRKRNLDGCERGDRKSPKEGKENRQYSKPRKKERAPTREETKGGDR